MLTNTGVLEIFVPTEVRISGIVSQPKINLNPRLRKREREIEHIWCRNPYKSRGV